MHEKYDGKNALGKSEPGAEGASHVPKATAREGQSWGLSPHMSPPKTNFFFFLLEDEWPRTGDSGRRSQHTPPEGAAGHTPLRPPASQALHLLYSPPTHPRLPTSPYRQTETRDPDQHLKPEE